MTFEEIFATVSPRMILDRPRARWLYDAAMKTANLPGDIAELGVYRGGSAKLMTLTCPQKKIWLFDTFAGLPTPTDVDKHHLGEFWARETAVREWMDGCNYEICAGRFPESVTLGVAHLKEFSLVHLDADLFQSTLDGLDFFWPRLVPGGLIVLDDWLWHACPGVEKAVKQFSGCLPVGKGMVGSVSMWESAKYQLTIEKVP